MRLGHLVKYSGARGCRRDAVDRNVMLGELLAERFRQCNAAGFRGTVSARVRIPFFSRDRRNVDDASIPPFEHVRNHLPAAVEHTIQIDVDDPPPLANGVFPSRHGGPCDPGVVAQDVAAA